MKRFQSIICLAVAGVLLTPASFAAPAKTAPKKAAPKKAAPKVQPVILEGKIKAIAKTPRPGTVPYKDCLAAIHLTGVKASKGTLPGSILLYVWTMRANKLTPQASLRAGQTVKFAVQPWDKVEDKYGRYQRRELDSDDVLALDAFFGEPSK
jgi:hypothetical protein